MFFTNLSKEQLRPLLAKYGSTEQFECDYISLFIQAGSRRVLVDTGMGTAGDFVPITGKLLDNLRSEGIEPDTIDTVIMTHGHPDHIGGNLDCSGRPAFPKARYTMYEAEWNYWISTPSLEELAVDRHFKKGILASARKNLSGIREQLDLLKGVTREIVPGISAVPSHGHTPGHISLEITAAGEKLLFVGDAFIHPIHVEHPETLALVDHHREETVQTRLRLLHKAIEEKCLVMGPHFPFPGLGHVVKTTENSWEWHPLSAF
jgi:glyoxylase-like metal-dependent hydrolase (beta-lactamase superfamily II)